MVFEPFYLKEDCFLVVADFGSQVELVKLASIVDSSFNIFPFAVG